MLVGVSTCKKCLVTTFADVTGLAACKHCPMGYWDSYTYGTYTGTRCTDFRGQKKITTKEKCAQARDKLGIADDAGYTGTNNVRSGSWSYLPEGCSRWGSRVHWNTYGHYRSCTYSSAYYCICDKTDIIQYTRANSGFCSSVSGQKVITTFADCDRYRISQGLSGTSSGSWSWLPQGCSMWGSSLHWNTYGHNRACDYSQSKYCVCDNTDNVHIRSSCKSCVQGQYQNYNKQTTCKQCPVGQYQNKNAQSGCKHCPTGQYQNSNSQAS